MALVHGAGQIVVNGLVLYLDAASPRSYPGSGTAWNDLSGNGINGTLNGVEYNSDNSGSLVFDGLEDYGTTSSSQFQSGNNPFTIEVWFRWFGNGTKTGNYIFSYGIDAIGGNKSPGMVIGSGSVLFEFGSSAGAVYSSTIQTNTWYQAVGTYDSSSTKIYLNGSLQSTASYSSADVPLTGGNGETTGIGCLFSSFANNQTYSTGTGGLKRYGTFNGNISVVKYYNRALTATEVTQNYNALKSRYINLSVPAVVTSGLQMYLDAGNLASYNPSTSGLTWTDLSGNGRNGTLSATSIGYSSANGGSLVFDGTDDLISTTFATTAGQAVTYAGWVYDTQTVDGTYKNFVDSISEKPMIWWNISGRIEFDTTSGGFTTTPIYRAQWVYVTLSKPSGSSSPSYYVNGFLVGTGSPYSTPAVTPTWLNRGGSNNWKGNCSIIQAYNRALTAAEVRQNFDATRSRYGI